MAKRTTPTVKVALRCNLCQYQTRFNGQLLEHFQTEHKDFKGFKCELCDFHSTSVVHAKAAPPASPCKGGNKLNSFIGFVTSHAAALDRHKKEEGHGSDATEDEEDPNDVSSPREEMKAHERKSLPDSDDHWWPQSTKSKHVRLPRSRSHLGDSDRAAKSTLDTTATAVLEDETAKQVEIPNSSNDFIWKYFALQKGTKKSKVQGVQCISCSMFFTTKGGDYGGLTFHLNKKHNIPCADSHIQSKSKESNQTEFTSRALSNLDGFRNELQTEASSLSEFGPLSNVDMISKPSDQNASKTTCNVSNDENNIVATDMDTGSGEAFEKLLESLPEKKSVPAATHNLCNGNGGDNLGGTDVEVIEVDDIPVVGLRNNPCEANVDTNDEDSDIVETGWDITDEDFSSGTESDPDSESDLDRISAAAERALHNKMKYYV